MAALDPDFALVEFDDFFGDGEAEADAFIFAGGGVVGLSEFVEDEFLFVFFEADSGVFDAEFVGVFMMFVFDGNLALVGEFVGVTDEVDEDAF